jgi:hypothetical protein
VGTEGEIGTKAPSPGSSPKKLGAGDPTTDKLAGIFDQYCKFAPASTALDNVKWFKCVSEMDLVDGKNVSRADVDLIFTKVKAKGERRINFQGFRAALVMLARKRHGLGEGEGDEIDQLSKLLSSTLTVSGTSESKETKPSSDGKDVATREISGSTSAGSPPAETATSPPAEKKKKVVKKAGTGSKTGTGEKKKKAATTGSSGKKSIFDKLTDTNQYTGSHKQRFDSDGKGRGLAGRDSLAKGGVGAYHGGAVNDLSQIMRPGLHQSAAKGSSPNAAKDTEMTKTGAKKKGGVKKKKDGPSIFDKLTDASLYTGAHKQRFDSTGKGRGLDGRDSGGVDRAKVSDLSQITNRK